MKRHNGRIGPIMVYDRATGQTEPEIVLGEAYVRLLYGNIFGRLLAEGIFKRRLFSCLYGRLQDSASSARKIANVARELRIDLSEAQKPIEEYRSFNDFFTRGLKRAARLIDPDPAAVISPCDARLLAYPRIHAAMDVNVKGSELSLRSLLADTALASRYTGGAMLVYRLCPADYHRFHFPEAGTPDPALRIDGHLHSVNPMALGTGLRILESNLRERTLLHTDGGTICTVEIGAMCVGSIVQTFAPGDPVSRGDQKGMFRFGGSTVIVLYEPGRVRVDEDILRNSREGLETLVKLGMRVGSYARVAR